MFIELKATKYSPYIFLKNGVFVFEGRSLLEEPNFFYNPIIKTIKDYLLCPKDKTIAIFKMEYLNSNAIRSIMNIIIQLETLLADGKEVCVEWYYNNENDFIFDAGSIMQSLTEIPINLKRIT